MNDVPPHKPTRKKKQLRLTRAIMDRRSNVLLELIKGNDNSQIAFKLKVNRHTVQNDIDTMIDDVIDWTNNLALIAWQKKVEEIYIESCESINHHTNLQKEIRENKDLKHFEFPDCPFDPKNPEQKDDYFKWLSEYRKAQGAFFRKPNQYSEYAQLENAKTNSKEFLVGMTTFIPLFAATQRLAIYYNQNEAQKLAALESATSAPPPSTSKSKTKSKTQLL